MLQSPLTAHFLFPCAFPLDNVRVTIETFMERALPPGERVARDVWLRAVEQLLSSRAGGSFSVFIPLVSGFRGDDPAHNPAVLVKQLQRRFPESTATWLMHVPAATLPSTSTWSPWCDSMLWTHRDIDDGVLDSLSLTPYLFDFLLLPESYLTARTTSSSNKGRKKNQQLSTLFGMAKATVIIPNDLQTFQLAPRVQAWLRSLWQSPRRQYAPPWILRMNITYKQEVASRDADGSPAVVLHRVMLQSLVRHTRHEFYAPKSRPSHHKTYRLYFDVRESWVPYLITWKQVEPSRSVPSQVLRLFRQYFGYPEPPIPQVRFNETTGQPLSPRTMYPRVSQDWSQVSLYGKPCHLYRTTPIELTDLAMVNIRLVLGLLPSAATRRALWQQAMAMPLFPDCIVANVCVKGRNTTWCDHDVDPSAFSPKYTVKRAADAHGDDCRGNFRAICRDGC